MTPTPNTAKLDNQPSASTDEYTWFHELLVQYRIDMMHEKPAEAAQRAYNSFTAHTQAIQTEARKAEINLLLRKRDWHEDDWGVDCIYRKPLTDRLAELTTKSEGSQDGTI